MSFQNVAKCSSQQQFMAQLDEMHYTMHFTIEDKSEIDKISEFFANNIDYILNDKAVAIQLDRIASHVSSSDEPLISKLQNYVGQLLPSKNKEEIESSRSFLKKNAEIGNYNNYIQSLADWINLMKIPLAPLNLPKDELFFLFPKLYYIDLCNLDFYKYNFQEFHLNIHASNFKLKTPDKETRYNFARHYAKTKGVYCQKFGIEDKTQLFEIALLCAQRIVGYTSEFIKEFGIENKTHLYEIAKVCAQQNGRGTAKFIKNFEIEDKRQLFEIAKLCNHAFDGTAEFIQNFGIEDKTQLFEIAKLYAQQNGDGTAKHIKKFGINDKAQLFEIAKLCTQRAQFGTAEHIKNFGIEDKTQLSEIAKLCSPGTALYLQNFRIEDKTQLFEIAMAGAQQSGSLTAQYIKKFWIEDKTQLYEIAKLCAQQDGFGPAEYIKNFEIEDKTQLFEIAMLCALHSGRNTAIYIENFGIENKTQLFEIAKLCTEKNGRETAMYIKNFGIEDKTQLFEIAKLCAQNNGRETAINIEQFGIEDKDQLYEIAKICAQGNKGGATAAHIENFGIKNEIHLFEIAKICAQQDGLKTSQFIKKFGFDNQTHLFEIAKFCAQQNGGETAKNIKNFDIDDPKKRWELFLECFKGDNSALSEVQHFLPLPDFIGKHPILLAELHSKILESNAEDKEPQNAFFKEVKSLIDNLPCSIENKDKLQKSSQRIANLSIHIQNETTVWFLKCLFISTLLQAEDLDWMLKSKLWDELEKLREPRLRSLLTPGLFEVSKCKRNVPKGTHGLPLIAIPFYQLQLQKVSKTKLKQITENLKRQQNKGNSLKNAVTVQSILHMTHLLAFTDTLSSEEKILGVNRIFFKKDGLIEDNIDTLLKKIAAAKALLQLKNKEWPYSKDPVDEFRALFQSLIPIKDFEGDVSDRFEEVFAKCRNPYGLITYAAGLKTLNDPEVMDCLARYVSTVFNGTFKETRYNTTNNPHLKTISESHQDVLEMWKQNVEKPLAKMSLEEEKKEIFNPKEWIRTKLIKDRHLGDIKIPFIEGYFKASSDEMKVLVFKKLTEEFQKMPSEILKLQHACIAFAEAESDDYTPLLKEIQACLDPRSEFAKDVEGLLKGKQAFFDLKVVITDDPIDLLLCGSDVTGSCQRLEGTPSLNKGLLGYLMDGKNRLLAIKDGKGKIIARCILRLLWDGERPVLYRERLYPDNCDSRLINALNQAAKELAKKLKTPLTCEDEGTPYGKPLHALGGPAPYEYCDGCRGMQKGPYKIDNANMIKEGEV